MRENSVRTRLANGDVVINGWLGIPSVYSAEVMAHADFHSLTIDMQHGPVHYDMALPMLTAICTTDVVPMARVPWNEPGIIMKMLDAGAYGIICPMINNRAECEAFVDAVRYPPVGSRSNGPNRAALYAGRDYVQNANDVVLAIAMIETAEAMQNLDDIMSVEGLDGIYVGPADLSISLRNQTPADVNCEENQKAYAEILAAAERHGIYPGIHTGSAAHALELIELGFQLVTLQSDAAFLGARAREVVGEVRSGTSSSSTSGSLY